MQAQRCTFYPPYLFIRPRSFTRDYIIPFMPTSAPRTSRIVYLSLCLLGFVYAVLCETDLLPTGYLPVTPQTAYALHMLCIVLTLAGTWGALRLFAVKRIKRALGDRPALLLPLNLLRTSIQALVIAVNLLIYYATLSTTPLYCLLISLVGFIFCWPKDEE